MMKKLFFIVFLFSVGMRFVNAQPTIQWQKSLGGSNAESAYDIQQTNDGGYVVAGGSKSNDGDVTGNNGSFDYWLVKLDVNGIIEWKKNYGGNGDDRPYAVQQTLDKGYIIVGYTFSNNGDVSGNHGLVDYWVVKVDSTGNIQWEKTYGGNNVEIGYDIQQTLDSGYAMVGFTQSNNGDVSVNHGLADCWVVKLDVSGTIQWEKSLGGSQSDLAYAILQTSDLSYVVVGQSSSSDGDVTGNNGGKDYWITKLDTSGNLLWQKNYGGSGDDIAYDVKQNSDGSYFIVGVSNSIDGDISNSNGSDDFWVIKLDILGNLIWENSYGGSNQDIAYSIALSIDSGYVISGRSNSTDGDVTGNHGQGDSWIVKIDSFGNLQWQKSYGGSSNEDAQSIFVTNDNGFVIAGTNGGDGGDVTGNHGVTDFWVVKLNPYTGMDELITEQEINVYPNPTNGIFTINTPINEGYLEVYDIIGKKVITEKIKEKKTIINLQYNEKGIYLLKILIENNVMVKKIIYR